MCLPAHLPVNQMTKFNLQNDYNSDNPINPYAFVQQSLLLPVTIDLQQELPESDICWTVFRCVEEAGLIQYVRTENRDGDDYPAIDMLKAVMLGWTEFGRPSVRDLEDLAHNNIRYRILFPGDTKPSFMAFHRFIHDDMSISAEDLLTKLNLYMASVLPEDINPENEEIDGTKEEADANKMTFVWRGATDKFYARCYASTFELFKQLIAHFNANNVKHPISLLHQFDLNYLMKVACFIEEYCKQQNIQFVYGKGKHKTKIQRWYDELKGYAIRIWKYQMHYDILEDRNSFSKTDPDATFMHMKYDYYNHTNVFKPGFNVQMGNVNGFIWDIYVSPDPNDMKTFIPLMEQHFRNYGCYPKRTGADAGYGSFDNYKFCKDHQMELYMKYPNYDARKKKKTDKNRFKSFMMDRDENGLPICPAGHSFRVEKTRTETRGVYPREMETLINDHCENCPLKSKCTKSKSGARRIQRCVQLEEWQEEVDNNLETELGKKIMQNRRVFAEGIFGDKKYNWKNDKLHRTGESGVKTEIYLYALGRNLRRFHKLYWERRREAEKKAAKLIEFARSVMPA